MLAAKEQLKVLLDGIVEVEIESEPAELVASQVDAIAAFASGARDLLLETELAGRCVAGKRPRSPDPDRTSG